MTSLGFENYAEALKIYLSKYREVSDIVATSADGPSPRPPPAKIEPDNHCRPNRPGVSKDQVVKVVLVPPLQVHQDPQMRHLLLSKVGLRGPIVSSVVNKEKLATTMETLTATCTVGKSQVDITAQQAGMVTRICVLPMAHNQASRCLSGKGWKTLRNSRSLSTRVRFRDRGWVRMGRGNF